MDRSIYVTKAYVQDLVEKFQVLKELHLFYFNLKSSLFMCFKRKLLALFIQQRT
jgi:hypothetical protein